MKSIGETAATLDQGFDDLIGNSHARQVFIRVWITVLFGVDDCKRSGQVFTVRVVMVADDEIQADSPGHGALRPGSGCRSPR